MRFNRYIAAATAAALITPLGLALNRAAAERAVPAAVTSATPSVAARESDGDLIRFAGGAIKLEYPAGEFAVSRAGLEGWIRDSARATTVFFGRFPVPYVRLVLQPVRGNEVKTGWAVGRPEPRITVAMGRSTTAAELARESLLVHEMVHLAIPDHDIRHIWLHEGIATYVEHVARAQAGLATARDVWAELMRELPVGLPEARDSGGLDGTPSNERRYWGGALFCLLADVEIRKATNNRLGLQDALRALQRQGGNLSRMWSFERTLEIADKATGTGTFTSLYRTMGNRPHVPDLARLWRDLGVGFDRGRVVLDETAPLAAIRRAITDRPSAPLLVSPPRLVRTTSAASGKTGAP